jgi:hypothetical protein
MLAYIKAQPYFEPEEIIVLVGAFDKAWQLLLKSGAKLDGQAEAAREILAKRIIEVAKQGELNQRRLSEDALAHLAAITLQNMPRPRAPKR